jgi:RecB family exonuclease
VWRRTGGTPRHALAAVPPGGAASVWADARERDAAALLAVSELGAREAATAYLATILDHDTAGRRLAMWRAARDPEPGPWDGLLGAGPRAALLSRSPFAREMPPTRLERYVACPFAFLLRDVLRLEAPEEPAEGIDMDALEFGQLAHRVLERTYDAVIAEGLDLDGALAALQSAWEAGCAEAEQQGVTGAALAWGARRTTLLDDLEESLRRDPVFGRGDGRPLQVEWPFGEAVGRAVSLDLADGREIRFSGRLDRVDETPRGARVIDYKTGKGTTERQRLKDRLSVQLPVYQLALRRAGEGRPAEIECVYRLVTRRGGFRDLSLPDAEPDALNVLRALVTEALALFEGGVLARSTAGRCEYCDVAYACGASSWTRARKRRHAGLARLVALQSSGPSEVSDAGGA